MNPPLSAPPFTRREAFWLLLLILIVLATRLPFLMHGLDEWDTANFALSVIHFSVPTHQPHPPGQYNYVRLMQFINLFTGNELFTLTLGSALGSTLALVPYYLALRQVFRPAVALGAAVLTAFTFGFWITSLRMISDPVASLFVYGTVCALLAGLSNARWFVFGMALCGVTLGVKQTSVYFLLPFTVVVNLVVLFRHGVRRPLVGGIVFALAVAAWLLPTVGNSGGWANYAAGCRAMQKENYAMESIIFRLTPEAAQIQGQQNFLQPWGADALAVVMLALAAGGLFPCCRRGLRGLLFGLFGLTVVGYAFFFLYHFNKYYVYYVPFYCALAAAALFAAGDFLARRTHLPRLRHLVPGLAIALITAANVFLTAPLLPKIAHFRAPPQAALEAIRKLPGAGPDPLLLTDDVTTGRQLFYFYLKKKVDLLNRHPDLRDAAAALNAGRKVYFLSPTVFATSPAQAGSVRLVGHYVWRQDLYGPLQGRPDLMQLSLYELSAPLPADYAFRNPAPRPPLLIDGMWVDGWCGPDAKIVLPCDEHGSELVHLEITAPEEFAYHYPYKLFCRFDDGHQANLTFEHAGRSDFMVPLPSHPGVRTVEIQLVAPQTARPSRLDPASGDNRDLSVRVDEVDCVSDAQPLIVRYEEGWYGPETDGTTRWRWADGDGVLTVQLGRTGTLVLDSAVLSSTGGNAVEVSVDGHPAAVAPIPGKGWDPVTYRLPLEAGFHRITLHSRNPGKQPPGDGRTLAICLRDFVPHVEN